MKQIELFQNALASSVETLINAEAQVRSHLKWLVEQKRIAIQRRSLGKVFNSDDICVQRQQIGHNVRMKVVAIGSEIKRDLYVDRFKCCGKYDYLSELFYINIFFMRNPAPLLDSKSRLTDREKSILKSMLKYYEFDYQEPDTEELRQLSNELRMLKHGYDMVVRHQWGYNFNDILNEDILKEGLQVNNVSITDSPGNDDDDDDDD